jgi:uncharacterized protein YqeY
MIIDQLKEDMKTAMKAGDKTRLDAKKRKESIETYGEGGRQDLVDKEQAEYDITISYLPAQLGEEELKAIVRKHVAAADGGPQAFGQVMKAVLAEAGSRADGKAVSALVKELLR